MVDAEELHLFATPGSEGASLLHGAGADGEGSGGEVEAAFGVASSGGDEAEMAALI